MIGKHYSFLEIRDEKLVKKNLNNKATGWSLLSPWGLLRFHHLLDVQLFFCSFRNASVFSLDKFFFSSCDVCSIWDTSCRTISFFKVFYQCFYSADDVFCWNFCRSWNLWTASSLWHRLFDVWKDLYDFQWLFLMCIVFSVYVTFPVVRIYSCVLFLSMLLLLLPRTVIFLLALQIITDGVYGLAPHVTLVLSLLLNLS